MKRNAVLKITKFEDGLLLKFADGKVLELKVGKDVQADSMLFRRAAIHGFCQKLVDAAAISRNPDTGKAATVADKYEAVRAVHDRLVAGEWNLPRATGPKGGILFAALVRMFEGRKSPEQVRAWLDEKTGVQQAALRTNAKVREHIVAIETELAKGQDSDGLLVELEVFDN